MKNGFNYEQKIYGQKENGIGLWFSDQGIFDFPKTLRRSKLKILDIGCGAGDYTRLVKNFCPGSKVYGIDTSRSAIKIARLDFPDITFQFGSAYRIPYPNRTFDLVIAKCVLEHLKDLQKAVGEVRRVLKKGGVFFSITPIEGDSRIISPKAVDTNKFHGHLQRFSEKSVIKLMTETGFRVVKTSFSGFVIRQLLEITYYPILNLFKLPPAFSVKTSIQNKSGVLTNAFSLVRNLTNLFINLESKLVPCSTPGLFIHLIATKT